MPTAASLQTASEYSALTSATSAEAVSKATQAAKQGTGFAAAVITRYQAALASVADQWSTHMLAEQNVIREADAMLNSAAFTTALDDVTRMLDSTSMQWEFDRLVASLVQEAGRAAQSVAVAATPRVEYVRLLTPPSCSRCAVLAGRVYRWSTGFLRHPGCDCIMVPTPEAGPLEPFDPVAAMEAGQITGLSKADAQALRDGANFGQIVNIRRKAAGLSESGYVLARAGRPTPAGIYRMATDRANAVELLRKYGYLL